MPDASEAAEVASTPIVTPDEPLGSPGRGNLGYGGVATTCTVGRGDSKSQPGGRTRRGRDRRAANAGVSAGRRSNTDRACDRAVVARVVAKSEPRLTVKQLAAKSRKEAKQRKREKKIESFKDYFRYQEPLAKIPPHRLLAINRGERSKILRVKIDIDPAALYERAEQRLIRPDHPHADFLRGCLRDALTRLLCPAWTARSAAN